MGSGMRRKIHILASCTNLKRFPVPRELHLRAVRGKSVVDRANNWWRRLKSHRGESVRAVDLYTGQHWAIVRELPAVAEGAGLNPQLWVLSAGYGFIPASARIHPYSATFSSSNPDTVITHAPEAGSKEESLQTWWVQLGRFKGPDRNAPRSIGELARRDPGAVIVIVASPTYVRAIELDAIEATRALEGSQHLLVISGRMEGRCSPLRDHLILSDASLRESLGGALFSLHARMARWVLEAAKHTALTVGAVRSRVNHLAEDAIEFVRPNRQRLTDTEIQTFIQRTLPELPHPSHSSLLRILRKNGWACEQGRFKAIYSQVVGTHAV